MQCPLDQQRDVLIEDAARRRYATITSSPGVATEIRYAPGSGGLRGAR
jgi:hypothetical protein